MSSQKELDFFLTRSDSAKGVDWYSAQFPDGYRVLGESSPNYTKCHLFPGVAKRLHSLLPDIGLIYLVRHPVDRAASQYIHQMSAGKEFRPVAQVFEDLNSNDYVDCGRYMFQLSEFLSFYPAERILVVDAADLLNDRVSVMSKVFRFVGVDDSFCSDLFSKMYNEGSSKRRASVLTRALYRLPGLSRIPSRSLPQKAIQKVTGTRIERPTIPIEVHERLLDYYKPDIEALEQHLGRRFPHWYKDAAVV